MTATRAERRLTVLDPGLLTTVQDDGRRGLAHLGVPRGGWLDPVSATLGNRLVGNPGAAAVLECLAGGCLLETATAVTLAVTGATCSVTVDGRAVAHSEALSLRAGARVRLGPVTAGLRAYVAVAGGVVVPPVLGSRATDTLSWTGPPRVVAGAVLPVGKPGEPPGSGPVVPRLALPAPGSDPVRLRWSPGPRADWFRRRALTRLGTAAYVVQPDSDRVALRLGLRPEVRPGFGPGSAAGPGTAGGAALERRADSPAELPSEGLVLGAIQVPPSGQPLVFLADHPTTGGYPVIAVVDRRDLPLCAHLRPGDEVRFAAG